MAKYITISELAENLQMSEKKVRQLSKEGIIPYYKIGGVLRYVEAEVDFHLKNNSRVMTCSEARQRVYGRL